MSGKTFTLKVFTQERQALDASVTSVTVPASDGQLGLLANHAPLMTVLGEGQLKVHTVDKGERLFRLSGGFLEVHDNKATVLTDSLSNEDGSAASDED